MNESILAFHGMNIVGRGSASHVTTLVKNLLAKASAESILTFEEATGRQIELDLHGHGKSPEPTAVPTPTSSGPGRPKLGVVGREVTLLPRHWEWLGAQPGGASIALRKLVEHSMKANQQADSARQRKENAYRFMSAMAGNLPGYEEAIRALFAGDEQAMNARMKDWPVDVKGYALELAGTGSEGAAA